MTEFKDIPGYEGLYEISREGVVYRKQQTYINNLGNKCIRKRRKIATRIVNGRPYITLCKDGKPKDHHIHRLLAETYIPNPNNYPMINHKDENIMNNSLDNLEWCTNSYNQSYGTCPQRKAKAQLNRQLVVKVLDEKHITIYESARYAARVNNGNHTNILRACENRKGYKNIKSFRWRFPTLSERIKFCKSNQREIEIEYD